MIYLVPFIALFMGVAIGVLSKLGPLPREQGQYFALACLAGLDTIFGGARGALEGKFRTDVMLTGFASNIVIAYFLAWLGDQIYINLYIAVALVLGARIFNNLSLIRRFALTQWTDAREKRRLQALAQQATANQNLGAGKPEPNS